MNGWIGVDLDGTLAEYNGWVSETHIGKPVPLMVTRVKTWLSRGQEVKIFTARISWEDGNAERLSQAERALPVIQRWCKEHWTDLGESSS